MTHRFPTSGLYAIVSPDEHSGEDLLRIAEAAVKGGVRVVQYRDKTGRSDPDRVRSLVDLCHRYGIPLIINDDISLANASGADGVHLGRDDGTIGQAREILGTDAIVGVSCYDSINRAVAGQREGATYVAFGRFFPSRTKPQATPADKSILLQAKTCIDVPIVAIGGITPQNGAELLDLGADLLAVIEGIRSASDPRSAAEQYVSLFSSRSNRGLR